MKLLHGLIPVLWLCLSSKVATPEVDRNMNSIGYVIVRTQRGRYIYMDLHNARPVI